MSKPPKPTHYEVICVSLYTRDIEDLAGMVTVLKRHGWAKANKSHLIRIALARLDSETLERIARDRGAR